MRIRDCNFIRQKTRRIEVAAFRDEGDKAREIHERKRRRANGGCLGYPEARKDVVSCEKLRGVANRH